MLQQVVDAVDELARGAVEALLRAAQLVLADLAVLLQLLQRVDGVAADDLQRVEESLGATLSLHGWRLRGDPSLHHGGCKVSADEGDLDASVATRWQELCRLAAPGVV